MYTANNTLEETIGLATAANTILQNPQSVGTTLKTVSMYIRAAKTELEEAGEDTEGIAESTGKLRDLIKQITREGGKAVDIMADDDQFKSTYQILEEISEVWDKISDTNQAALLEKLGGKRNANAIAAILENFDIARQAMEAATNAEGSAMAELEKYQQSIEGHIVALKTQFQELSDTVIDGDAVKGVVDFGRAMLDAATKVAKLVDSLGGLQTILIAVSGIITIRSIMGMSAGLERLVRVTGSLRGAFGFLGGKAGGGIATAFKALVGGLAGPQGIMAASLALITGISAAVAKYKQKQEELRQELVETGKTAAADSKELIDLYNRYTDLSEQINLDKDSKEELSKVTDELLKKLGIEKTGVDNLAGSYGTLNEKINALTAGQLEDKLNDINTAIAAKQEDLLAAAYPNDGWFNFEGTGLFQGFEYGRMLVSDVWGKQVIEALKAAGFSNVSMSNDGRVNIDLGHASGGTDVANIYSIYDEMKKALTRANMGDTETFAELSRRTSMVSGDVRELNKLEQEWAQIRHDLDSIGKKNSTNGDIGRQSAVSQSEKLINERDAIRERTEALNEYVEAFDDLIAIENEARDAGYTDISETIFGNIDTNNRQILEWTQKNIDKYREILESWGYTEEDLQEMLGSFSTVMGTSMGFDDLEIAFSPILQTEDGPVLLSSDTVARYISNLIRELADSGAEWTDEDLLRIDTRGLEVDGVFVKNILAGVGDEARRVGEVMHYAGTDGALQDSFIRLRSAASKAGVPLAKFRDNIDDVRDEAVKGEEALGKLNLQIENLENRSSAPKTYQKDITEYTNKLKTLTNAWNEFKESGQISSNTYQKINAEFKEESSLVEIVNGKLSLNADAVEKLNEKLRDEYGLKIALAGASGEEISYIDALAGSLSNLAEKTEDPTSDLKELTGVLSDMSKGIELSTFDMLDLIQKYPQLRDKIIRTANGYKVEESAIRDLIRVKSQLLTLNEREIGISSARTALITRTGGGQTAAKVDKIFADFEAANGKAITSINEFAKAYFKANNSVYRVATEERDGVFEEYSNYVNARIDLNNGLKADADALAWALEDINDVVKEGYDPTKEDKTSSSSSEKAETEFERMYKLHQHYLALDKETEEQYLNWLDGAYKASYAAGEMELDDYYRYEEEVYEKRKELFTQSLNETQHQIDLLSHRTGDTSAEQIALYEQMQKKLNQQANAYRARGIKDNDELIRELQNQWWQYEDNIRQLRENAFNDWLNDRKFVIDQLKQDDASSDEIVRSWKEVLARINEEIAYYLSKGHDITSDVIQSLMKELEDAKNSITDALEEIVSKANEVVDGFQNVYTTLTNAAKEYASTGYLSVDSLQSILELGPKYMDMLYDESGQLMINEEALQKVIAARTEEMAAETALSYAKQVLLATEEGESQKLKELTDVQAASSAATWDMAYATLGYARALGATKGISEDYYNKAIQYVTRMQSVTKTATDSISAYYKTLDEGYVSQADGLETILKLTEDMLKQENSDRIKQLEDEKDAYKDIIDQKKEILRLTKEQQNHDRDMADKLKEISDLQSKIDQLALDDSREARAQRAKLEEQLLEKQRDLADDQADYAIEAQEDALDKQYDAYEKEKDKEIDALKDELNSAEKLYRAAIDRISNGWDTLYSDLLNWNYNYGNTLEKDLTKAWEAAKAAAERYGDFVSAMEGVRQHDELGPASTSPTDEAVQNAVSIGSEQFGNGQRIIDQMRANSIAWFTGDQEFLSGENQRLANDYRAATGRSLNYRNGFWYEEGSSTPIYDLSKDQAARNQIGNAVVAAMKTNSALWKSSDQATRKELEKKNEDLAAKLANFLGRPITKTQGGVWMMGNTPLYEITKFHTGGIVGGRGSLRQNEIMALLRKGEAVLDERREQALYKTVDFVQILSDKIGRVIDRGRLSSLLEGTGSSFPKNTLPALAGGIGTMNFAPTVQVTITGAGDLDETTARKYGSIAADSVLQQLKNAFSQRGVSAAGNSILK